jgi:hypothetical protein
MISTVQREALAVLAELCELSEDVRLGQLLAWLGELGVDQTGRTLWDVDDEQFLAVLYRHREELIARLPEPQRKAMASRKTSNPPIDQPTNAPLSTSAEIGHR